MKTIKTKKSVGNIYVYQYYFLDRNRKLYMALETRELAEKSRNSHIEYKNYTNISEIAEVELFEEVEEQVPDIVERWYFVASKGEDDIIHTRKEEEKQDLVDTKKGAISCGYRCSEIKLFREEF